MMEQESDLVVKVRQEKMEVPQEISMFLYLLMIMNFLKEVMLIF